jgi:hypothetical protein
MKRFLVLYRSPVSASEQLANATPEQMQAGMQAWMSWAERAGDAVVDLGSPLGGGTRIAGGSVSGDDTDATGFSIVQAESAEDAAELFRDHPHLGMPGGGSSIEIFELLPLPGS